MQYCALSTEVTHDYTDALPAARLRTLAFSESGMAQPAKPGAGPTIHVIVMGAEGIPFKRLYRGASGKPIDE